jgi:hypothetical protein
MTIITVSRMLYPLLFIRILRILEIAETPSLERDLLKNYATNANSLGVEK